MINNFFKLKSCQSVAINPTNKLKNNALINPNIPITIPAIAKPRFSSFNPFDEKTIANIARTISTRGTGMKLASDNTNPMTPLLLAGAPPLLFAG